MVKVGDTHIFEVQGNFGSSSKPWFAVGERIQSVVCDWVI
jgi:hypothetical protein